MMVADVDVTSSCSAGRRLAAASRTTSTTKPTTSPATSACRWRWPPAPAPAASCAESYSVSADLPARPAATWLAAVAGGLDLEVHVVTAFEPMVEWVPRSSATSVWAKVRDQLDGQWTAPLRRAGVDYSTHLIEGINVANTLVDCARRRHADAVIVGLGDSAANRRRHPGTDLLERCHLPVILVPVDKTEMVEERQ